MNNSAIILSDMGEVERAASAMSKSGYFQDSRDQAQAVVKILAGRELGIGPFASMTGIYIISGRPAISANLMASAVKRSGRYNYRVVEHSDTVCEIAFFEDKVEIGRSRFTADDARKAGTKNMDKYARNMLFARAMSNGVRWYCPDVFTTPTYTPEELGANVDADGDVILGQFTQSPAPAVVIEPEPERMTVAEAAEVTSKNGRKYGDMNIVDLKSVLLLMRGAMERNGLSEEAKRLLTRNIAAAEIMIAVKESENGQQ